MTGVAENSVVYFTAARGWKCNDYIDAIKSKYQKVPQKLLWYFELSSTSTLSPVDMLEIAFLFNNRVTNSKMALVAESSAEYQHLLYYQAYASGYNKEQCCELFNSREDAEKWLMGS